jgi:hypothetical protein
MCETLFSVGAYSFCYNCRMLHLRIAALSVGLAMVAFAARAETPQECESNGYLVFLAIEYHAKYDTSEIETMSEMKSALAPTGDAHGRMDPESESRIVEIVRYAFAHLAEGSVDAGKTYRTECMANRDDDTEPSK